MDNTDNAFINSHTQSPVTVFLISGIKLDGSITGNGDISILLSRNGVTQLVMKHAIATIMPQGA